MKKTINDYNREVRTYNSKVRQHNQRVENQRRRLNQEVRRLQSRPTSTSFTTVRTTTTSFVTAYDRAETQLSGSTGVTRDYLDLASDEAANSVYLLNALDGDGDPDDDMSPEELAAPSLATELARFGSDIVDRWTGALFSLSAQNPDAARHFCTSAREVVISILDTSAPDQEVIRRLPDCEVTDKKVPTRRAKVTYHERMTMRVRAIQRPEVARVGAATRPDD